jgi:hypothetical protein
MASDKGSTATYDSADEGFGFGGGNSRSFFSADNPFSGDSTRRRLRKKRDSGADDNDNLGPKLRGGAMMKRTYRRRIIADD